MSTISHLSWTPVQLLVLDASLLLTATDFHERRALLCRSYTEDCVFEDPLACCRGKTATFLYMELWRLLFPEILIEGRPPKLPSSKAGTTQVIHNYCNRLHGLVWYNHLFCSGDADVLNRAFKCGGKDLVIHHESNFEDMGKSAHNRAWNSL